MHEFWKINNRYKIYKQIGFGLIKNDLFVYNKVEEVSDYHIYPIADNDTPKLSKQRNSRNSR